MLRYPLTLDENENDYVVFTHFPYTPNRAEKFNFKSSDAAPPGETDSPGIVLYMPNTTPVLTNNNSWASSGNNFAGPLNSTIAAAAANLGGTASDILGSSTDLQSAINQGMEAGGHTMKDIISNARAAVGGQFTARVAGMVAGAAGVNMNENSIMQLSRGQIFNPNVELLYNGPSVRGFTFTFMFVAKSKEESGVVDKIILEFKKWSSPEAADDSGGLMNIPHLWSVKYKGLVEGKMNKFKNSALTTVAVQDNQGFKHHATFDDGTPIVTTITLTFTEVDIITRKDHVDAGGRGY